MNTNINLSIIAALLILAIILGYEIIKAEKEFQLDQCGETIEIDGRIEIKKN